MKKIKLFFGGFFIMFGMQNLSSTELTTIQKLMAEKSTKMISEKNPIIAHKFGADPTVLVYKDTVYVYATNDMQQVEFSQGNIDNGYEKINSLNVFCSKDLANWTDCGEIQVAGKNGGKGDALWASNSWAPAICYKNLNGIDKFFLYFADSGNGIGVLTSESPLGPFVDPIKKPLISRQTPNCANVNWLFDPAVLVDDDGKGYLYFGGGHDSDKYAHPKTARCVELNDDMISIKGEPREIDAPYLFEDSGINKIGNKYYYSYCSNWAERSPEEKKDKKVPPTAVICYMTSENPLGPFEYQGYTLKNPGNYFGAWGNNHHWIFEFNKKFYIAYHTQIQEKKLGFNKSGYRSIFIDEFLVNSDGTLPIQGVALIGNLQVKNFNPYEQINAATFHSSKFIGVTSNQTVKSVKDGNYIFIKNVDLSKGIKKILLKTVPLNGKKAKVNFYIETPSKKSILISEIKVGKKSEITKKVKFLEENYGIHNLKITFEGEVELVSWKME